MKIKIGKDKVLWSGKFTRMIRRDFVGINGKKGLWEILERKTHGPVAIVIPVTAVGEVIFIKHYRIPRKGYVLESPAGLMDVKGEKPIALARRELLEETGYKARHIKRVAVGTNNSGLQNEDYHFFVATGCVKITEPLHESAEDITLIKVPLAELNSFLLARRNYPVASPLYAIPFFLKKAGVIG